MASKEQKLVEVARSFSFKLNVGNFESRDFFCSQKREVPEEDAVKISEELYKFCEDEVMKSVYSYKIENNLTQPKPKLTRQDYAIAQAEAPKSQAEEDLGEEERLKAKLEEKVEEQLPIIEYGKNL